MNKKFYINSYAVWRGNSENTLPDVSFVPPLVRRRLTGVEKIGISLANQVCGGRDDYFVVFASRFGEWGQTIKLIRQFYEDVEMSPAGFSTSVHNAMPGILSVLRHNRMAYTAVAANERTLDNALVEAFCGKKPVLFIYAEEKMPEIYAGVCPVECQFGYGCAFLISDAVDAVGEAADTDGADCAGLVEVCSGTGDRVISFDELVEFLQADTGALQGAYLTIRKL